MHACRYVCTYVYHVHAVLMEAKQMHQIPLTEDYELPGPMQE